MLRGVVETKQPGIAGAHPDFAIRILIEAGDFIAVEAAAGIEYTHLIAVVARQSGPGAAPQKARFVLQHTGDGTLADDTGRHRAFKGKAGHLSACEAGQAEQ